MSAIFVDSVSLIMRPENKNRYPDLYKTALFVFSMHGPKQNAGSLLTPISYTVFDAISHGTLGFALLGSYLNQFLIGRNSPTANQILCIK